MLSGHIQHGIWNLLLNHRSITIVAWAIFFHNSWPRSPILFAFITKKRERFLINKEISKIVLDSFHAKMKDVTKVRNIPWDCRCL